MQTRLTPRTARAVLPIATALWGLTFTANHELLEVLTPQQIIVLRFAGVSAVLLLLLAFVPALRPRLSPREWVTIGLCGIMAVPGSQFAVTYGQRYLSPSMSGLVAATGPAFTALVAAVLLSERLRRRGALGIALAFSGAAIVIVLTSGSGTELTVRNPLGAAFVAFAQLSWAVYTVVSKRLVEDHQPLSIVAAAILVGSATMLPFSGDVVGTVALLGAREWLWLGHLVLLGTVVPYAIWFTSLRTLAANETAAFMFLVPAFAVLWSALLVGERPAPIGLLGGVLIIVGVVLTQLPARQPASSRRRGVSPSQT